MILGPFVGSRWRRAGRDPARRVRASCGSSCRWSSRPRSSSRSPSARRSGAATLLAFGRPDQHPSLPAVARQPRRLPALAAAELAPVDVSRRGSRDFLATLADGGQVLAKVRSPEERSADLLFRIYRYLRLKNVGDERPFISLRRSGRARGARVPARARRRRAHAAPARHRGGRRRLDAARATTTSTGTRSTRSRATRSTTRCSSRCGSRSRSCATHRIAHRDLRRSNIVVDDVGRALDRSTSAFSEVAVADSLLDADVAQLLAALTLAVGAGARGRHRARRCSASTRCARRSRLLQLNALSGATRSALRQRTRTAEGAAGDRRGAAVCRRSARVRAARTPRPARRSSRS